MGLIIRNATTIGISHIWYTSPCAKGAYNAMFVKVGFNAIAKAAKTIVSVSFLVFKHGSSYGC